MSLQLIHATVSPEHVVAVEAAIGEVFTELADAQPSGLHYASTKASDGVSYLILVDIEDPAHNPLPTLAAFRRFQTQLQRWLVGPPVIDQLIVIGNYRVF